MIFLLLFDIGLALGGGSAFGFAHIGVLKVLEQEKIPISYISGTSMGAIIGALYAAGYSPEEIESLTTTVDWAKFFSSQNIPLPRYEIKTLFPYISEFTLGINGFKPVLPEGINNGYKIENFLKKLLMYAEIHSGGNFDSLMIPFRCTATEMNSGKIKIFKNGDLTSALRASIAMPGIFSPAIMGDSIYQDGGILDNVPVDCLPEENLKLASYILRKKLDKVNNLLDVLKQSQILILNYLNESSASNADIKIPILLKDNFNFIFKNAKKYISSGEFYTKVKIPEIKKFLPQEIDYNIEEKRHNFTNKRNYYIKSINFEGTKIKPEIVLKNYSLRQGDILIPERIYETVNNLYATGLFRKISLSLKKLNASDSVSLNFYVSEKKPSTLRTGFFIDNFHNKEVTLSYGFKHIRKYYFDFSFGGAYGDKKIIYSLLSMENLTKENFEFSLLLHYTNDTIKFKNTRIIHYGTLIRINNFFKNNRIQSSLSLGLENKSLYFINIFYNKPPNEVNPFNRQGLFSQFMFETGVPHFSSYDYSVGYIKLIYYKKISNQFRIYTGAQFYIENGYPPDFRRKILGDVDILPEHPLYQSAVENFFVLNTYPRFRLLSFNVFNINTDLYFSSHIDLGIINNNYDNINIYISPFLELFPGPIRIGLISKKIYVSFGKNFF